MVNEKNLAVGYMIVASQIFFGNGVRGKEYAYSESLGNYVCNVKLYFYSCLNSVFDHSSCLLMY